MKKKALTSAIVSVAMVLSSVSAIAADTASANSAPVVQTGPLSPGGPVVVSPAQGEVTDLLCPGGDCTPVLVVLGVAGMGVLLAAIMGAFSQNNKIVSTASTTNTQ